MKILFAGTPEIAVPSLRALADGKFPVTAVLTAPDAPSGRKRVLTPPPVKTLANQLGIPVLQPVRLDGAAREAVASTDPELLVVMAYGKIFGPRFLDLFPRGGVNVHPSLLPRHRGPSPIPAAILAGDTVTGITIQQLALEVDAGDILAQREIPLAPDATTPSLEREMADLGAALLVDVVSRIADGRERAYSQNPEQATWCRLLRKEDGLITWNEKAVEIERMIRAYMPWPGVRCGWNNTVLHLLHASVVSADVETDPVVSGKSPGTVLGVDNRAGILVKTVDGVLAVSRLKLQARKEMDFRSFLNGNSSIIGSVLEQA